MILGLNQEFLKGRLLYIAWIKVNGDMVYKAEKPQTESPEANPQQQKPTDKNEDTTQNKTSVECPFNEQLGNQVTVLKTDPDFKRKVDWLSKQGYEYDLNNDIWSLVNH